jgi:hypothetical protein
VIVTAPHGRPLTLATNNAGRIRQLRLTDMGYTHHYTTGYNAADRSAALPGVHLIASLLKRWIAGTLHHRVSNEQR